MTTHAENHDRVKQAIRQPIIAFCNAHAGRRFHMDDLTRYVRSHVPTAPDSAGRILRALRQEGVIDYRLVSRSASEYEIPPREPKQLALVDPTAGGGPLQGVGDSANPAASELRFRGT